MENLDNFKLLAIRMGGWIISGVAEQVEKKIAAIVPRCLHAGERQRVLDTNCRAAAPRSRTR
jgi:hypothetical protein